MMQKFFVFLLLPSMLWATSLKKEFRRGNYDRVIKLVIKEVLRGVANKKELAIMDKAYGLANQIDTKKILFLSQEGTVENYKEVITLYENLIVRQEIVKDIKPALKGDFLHLNEDVDYAYRRDVFKEAAIKYFYTEGKRLLEEGKGKIEFRKAYTYFRGIKNFVGYTLHKDLKILSMEAKNRGLTRISVDLVNSSRQKLPRDITKKIFSYNTLAINDEWKKFYLPPYLKQKYDYKIQIKINNVNISEETTRDFKNDIQDSSNGKITGKVKKKKESKETSHNQEMKIIHSKTMNISGEILLMDTKHNKIIARETFGERKDFRKGELGSLSGKKYPTSTQMLSILMDKIKQVVYATILKFRSDIE